jgi:predicted RNA-binding Zn-ribbon protein involved in translation (DUF1610 family)
MSKGGKIQAPKKTSVDVDYNRQVKQFSTELSQVQAKKKKLKTLQTKYDTLSGRKICDLTTEEINHLHSFKTEIDELLADINKTENMTAVTDFYLKTGELLINYYETTQERNVLSFFKPNQEKPCAQRADIYEQYITCTDPHHVANSEYNKSEEFCSECGVNRELVASEALLVCPKCGDEKQTIMESDKPSYNDPPHENMYFAYKRINHFKEQLAHFQAKENTKIPQEIYDVILIELKKEKKTNLATLTRTKVKKYLQKYCHMGYNKYYENINQIICHLNGIQPFSMKPEVEEQLCNMFLKIQDSFERHCPPGRTNFLSYSYVIYKFCQLLNYTEYLKSFNLLKSKDKLRQQDKIWKNICADLGWTFHPSSTS